MTQVMLGSVFKRIPCKRLCRLDQAKDCFSKMSGT